MTLLLEKNWQAVLKAAAPVALLQTQPQILAFREKFLTWYQGEKRVLPWRKDTDPYHVWVSEIMLQQTRVETVIPYYLNFMQEFPTIAALANAPEEKLLKAWEGLGYYSRVRNMQSAAQQIMADYGGRFPQTVAEIRQLKGIGPYTAGAIASISWQLAEPAVDGNAFRVISRLLGISADISKPQTFKIFHEVLRYLIDPVAPGDFNQALMDLGSQICTPKTPQCPECPVNEFCYAAESGTALDFPVKTKKLKPKPVYYVALLLENTNGEYQIMQRPENGLLANLWTFPLVEVSAADYQKISAPRAVETAATPQLEQSVAEKKSVYQGESPPPWWQQLLLSPELAATEMVLQKKVAGQVTHVFSHLKWQIAVIYGRSETLTSETAVWAKPENFKNYPFPTVQKKIVKILENT